jgi:nucleotide-binding universal stress UspA family protein
MYKHILVPTDGSPLSLKAAKEAAKITAIHVIVMGSHGRGGIASLLLGTETQKVLTHSRKPVFACR